MSESNKERLTKDRNLTYWNEQWLANKIGFHRLTVNNHFKNHILSKISSIEQPQCVLFPLCGKSVDMKAVLDAKHQVIGIECVQLAIEAFFEENNIKYAIDDECQVYKGINRPITIFSTDFFTFNRSLPTIDWIWDRGGLVAVNVTDREKYRDNLLKLMTPSHTQLYLLAFYYDDLTFPGPPTCLSDDDIADLFGSTCSIKLIEVLDTTSEFNLRYNQNLRLMEDHLHLIVRK